MASLQIAEYLNLPLEVAFKRPLVRLGWSLYKIETSSF